MLVGCCLEICLRAELEDTRIGDAINPASVTVISIGAGAELASENAGVNSCKLRVVPCVERLCLELDTGPFSEVEILEQGDVPSVTSRAFH
jgi:hypothetical protein